MERDHGQKSFIPDLSRVLDILFYPFRRWLSVLDRYIIQKYFVTVLFTFAIITAITVVIDYSEKSGTFVKNKPPFNELMFDYYLNFIPHIAAILAPLLIFLATIIFTARMAYNSEVIAMLNSGMNFRRFLRPYLICAAFSAALLLYANHWLVPVANKTRIDFENKYVRHQKNWGNNIHMRLDNNTYVSLNRFNYEKEEGTQFALERFSGTGKDRKLVYKINAIRIEFIPGVSNNWRLHQFKRWHIVGLEESFESGRQMDTLLAMEPGDFEVNTVIREALNIKEINAFMEVEKMRGAGGIEFYMVENNRRTAAAISVFILIVIGAIVGSRKVRGGMGLNIVTAIAMSALYMVFLQFSSSFSVNGNLPPVLGANIPNIIFGVISIYLFRSVLK